MKRILALLALGACLTLSATATSQSVGFRAYGVTCDYFRQPATLAARFDARTMDVTFRLTSSTTCCNTHLGNQFLLVGVQALRPGIASPRLVPGCELAVVPVATLPRQNRDGTWTIRVPRLLNVGTEFYFQGVNQYFTTVTRTVDFQLSNGLAMRIGR